MSMTRAQVLAILKTKKYGQPYCRDNGGRSGDEWRQYHREQLAALVEPRKEPTVFDADAPDTMTLGEFRAWLKQVRAERDAWRKERDKHSGQARFYRYAVGHVNNLVAFSAFHVEGEGDTWEAALLAAGYTLPEKRKTPTCRKCDAAHWPFQPCA